jgi:hypothetical protein
MLGCGPCWFSFCFLVLLSMGARVVVLSFYIYRKLDAHVKNTRAGCFLFAICANTFRNSKPRIPCASARLVAATRFAGADF